MPNGRRSDAGLATAFATASAGTDPFVLAPLDTDTPALLHVDLLSNYPSDLNAAVHLVAQASPTDGSANASFSIDATTNIPGLATLFTLTCTAASSSSSAVVTFSSPLISQPIMSTDFVSSTAGDYTLQNDKTAFDVPFTIPAGVLSTDPSLGDVGLVQISGAAVWPGSVVAQWAQGLVQHLPRQRRVLGHGAVAGSRPVVSRPPGGTFRSDVVSAGAAVGANLDDLLLLSSVAPRSTLGRPNRE